MKSTLIPLRDPQNPALTTRPLWRLGFRPFYLLAAAFAAFAVPFWILGYSGQLHLPTALPLPLWHAHEMIFGFIVAVITGFLFTAVRNWTGQPTPTGLPLALIALLWVLGRLALLMGSLPYAMWIDMSFLPVVAIAVARPLWLRRQRRNYFVPLLLLGLALINAWFYRRVLAISPGSRVQPLLAALGLITVLETIIAGRVVPMFTRNAIPGVRQYRLEWLERSLPLLTLLTMASFVLWPFSWTCKILALGAALGHALRWWGWGPLATWRKPILWILHGAYAWMIVGFLAMAAISPQGGSLMLPVHLLAVGATAGLIIGMMTRTARGHTGRFLETDREDVLAYVALMLATVTRILPLLLSLSRPAALILLSLSALLWSLAFVLYLIHYGPWLTRPRLDHQDG